MNRGSCARRIGMDGEAQNAVVAGYGEALQRCQTSVPAMRRSRLFSVPHAGGVLQVHLL